MATTTATKLMIGKVRFSYANVHTPSSVGDEPPAYSIVLLIPKKDKSLVEKVKAAINAAKEEGKVSKWKNKIPGDLKITLHDGDEEKPDQEVYAGHYFINARNKRKPGIMLRVNGNNEPLVNTDDFYSGCYGWATVNFFPYDNKGKGVGASLGNLLKTEDGERLAGGASAEEDFADFTDTGDDMM